MNDYIAYCGLDCEVCEARVAGLKGLIDGSEISKTDPEICGSGYEV